MTHPVRAFAFHHEGGYEEQRKLALAFAGEGGRIATVEDIVHARLVSGVRDNPWTHTVITNSRVYYGRSRSGLPLLVFAHGNGPEGAVSQETFEQLISGIYGEVAIVDMSTYQNASVLTDKKAGNRYTYEEACKDEIARAFFGRQAEEFFAYHQRQTELWLNGAEDPHETGVLLVSRIYDLYDQHTGSYRFPYGDGAASYPLTISAAGYTTHGDRPVKGITEFDKETKSDIDDLIFTPYFIVGIRDREPLTEFERDFRFVVPDVKRKWPLFVQPIADVPNDQFVGIKPDGSRERPYYLLSRWGSTSECTGRILENGTHSQVPEYRIKRLTPVSGPTVCFPSKLSERGYPYPGMWDAVLSTFPNGANAVSFGGATHAGGVCTINPSYWHVEVEEEAFQILMKCGDDFFTQYCDVMAPTSQPYRHVRKWTLIGKSERQRIPKDVANLMTHEGKWSILSHLMAKAPEGANALWLEMGSWSHPTYVNVHYFSVELGDMAFRPFTEIRADFDWQLARRAEAGLLQAM